MAAEDVTEVTKLPESAAAAAPPAEEPVKESSAAAAAEGEAAAAAPAAAEAPAPEGEAKKEEEVAAKEGETPAPAAKEEKPAKPPKPTKEELEKKALEEFKIKVAEAIKSKAFEPPPPPPPKEEPAKEEPAKEEGKEEVKEEAAAAAATATEAEKKPEDEKAPAEEPVPPPAAAVESTEKAVEPEPAAAAVEQPKEEEKIEEAPKEPEVEETPAEDVYMWGIPLLHTEGDARTEVVLNKFLKARDFKVGQALTMLKDTVLWRKSYKADELLDEDLGTDFDRMAFMFGEDKEGHPVCYNVFGVLQDKELYSKVFGDDAAKFLRWRVQLQEKGVKMLSFQPDAPNALLQVIDLKGAPWPAKKVRSVLLSQGISLLQDNYPELVIKNVFINVPWFYSAIFSLISPFLTQHQKSKFMVTRLGKSTEALFKLISPEKVPIQYGGLGRADDEEFTGADAPVAELPIKAGEKKTVELPVTAGSSVTWDMVVVGSDVSYGSEFQPDQEGGYTTIIEKARKLPTHAEEPIRNSFKASDTGKVVLTIDNSLSKKKKSLVYRHIVKAA